MIDQATLLSALMEHADKSDNPEIKDFFKSGATKEAWKKAISEAKFFKLK